MTRKNDGILPPWKKRDMRSIITWRSECPSRRESKERQEELAWNRRNSKSYRRLPPYQGKKKKKNE
jgi:hypothetical protein